MKTISIQEWLRIAHLLSVSEVDKAYELLNQYPIPKSKLSANKIVLKLLEFYEKTQNDIHLMNAIEFIYRYVERLEKRQKTKLKEPCVVVKKMPLDVQ